MAGPGVTVARKAIDKNASQFSKDITPKILKSISLTSHRDTKLHHTILLIDLMLIKGEILFESAFQTPNLWVGSPLSELQ
ncbi:hypothetical protein TUMSATVNIG1_53450 [Vibrio nigripulchritudo]|nr:hypothetical protein VNTUMSATTG_53060 [Vibrio nigripulchritudo]BDU34736.1 hypothetical protein TUMSATVNIG1_53450 [Vibrio nigripulchritudo]